METNVKRDFLNSTIGRVDGYGRDLEERSKGVTIDLRLKNGVPSFAEVYDTTTEGQNFYAVIGLIVKNNILLDYDGVFNLPTELRTMLKELAVNLDEI